MKGELPPPPPPLPNFAKFRGAKPEKRSISLSLSRALNRGVLSRFGAAAEVSPPAAVVCRWGWVDGGFVR